MTPAAVRTAQWTVLLALLHLASTAVLTITRHDGQFINYIDVQAFGRTATYSCSDADAQWYYPDGTLVSSNRSLDLYQMVRRRDDEVTLVISSFSATLQGYYVCSVANSAMSATIGVFVTANLFPVNLNVAANTDDGSVSFTWQTETGPEPISNYMVEMGEVQFIVNSNRPFAAVLHRDLLRGQQTRQVTFSVTSVIAGTRWLSETSAVIVSGPDQVSAQPVNTSTIQVDWDPLVNDSPLVANITGYMVEFRRSADAVYQLYGPMNQPPALISGLFSSTMYSFRVVPVARSNTSSGIVGPFPSALTAASTPATAEPPQTPFPRPQEGVTYHGAIAGAVLVSLLIFGGAVAIGVLALLLVARRQKRTRLVRATVKSFRRSPSMDSNMAVKPRPQSTHVDGTGSKPHRLKSFVQKKSSFILSRRTCQSFNNSRRESETKDVVGYEDSVETVPPMGGDKEKKYRKDYANIALQPPDEDPTYCVDIQSFPDYVKAMHQQREKGFEREYDDLCRETEYVPHTTIVARYNRVKNRFNNIFTYDHTRVVLSAPDKDGSDYINASFIDGHSRPNAYISAQGPTPETISDFWQMIWDQKSPVIVMLTKVEEKGRKKCERYWLQECYAPYEMGRELSVTLEEFKLYAECEKREFTVQKLDQPQAPPHKVTHFLFTGWPDHGVPQHPSSLLRFAQKVRAVYNAHQAPMVVHCSAGVGRSGTFITIDAQIQRLKDLNNVNIYHFVREMRNCRTHMVQTLDQYVFIHDATFDHIVCGDTSIAASSLKSKLPKLTAIDPKTGVSELHTEYELLNSVCMVTNEEDRKFFSKPLVSRKNRYPDKYPYSQKYLYLLGRSAAKGSEYINASFVNSYLSDNDYIAAQSPMESTVDDVWQLIWQFRCGIVVTLGKCEEEGEEMCYQFWPETEGRYLHITVETSSVENKKDYSVYKHQVHDGMKQSVPLEVTHFHYQSWPRDGRPNMTTLLQMMVESMKVKKASRRPTFVMCSDGMDRTGTYICIASEVEHLRLEGSLDVFQSVKLARCQRPHLVSTEENYTLCYRTLQAYVESFDDYANFKDLS